jgi:hypothetical protein
MMRKKIIYLGLVVLFAVVVLSVPAFSCIDLSLGFSSEVLLTKPGIQYDLSKISNVIDVKHKKIHFDAVEGLAYASHYDPKVVVIIAEDSLKKPVLKPRLSDNEYETAEYEETKGLNVLIQIPYKQGLSGMTEAVNVNRDTFDFKAAMSQELNWLKEVGVIQSLSSEDISQIVSLTDHFSSGENRIIFHEGKWKSSSYLAGNEGLKSLDSLKSLPRGGSCSRSFDQDEIMELVQ